MSAFFGRGLTLLLIVFLIGCSPQIIKIDQSTRESLKQTSQIKAIHYNPPDLLVPINQSLLMGFGAVGGALAGLQAQSQAQQMTKEYGLQNPAIRVKSTFLSSISKQLESNSLTSLEEPLKDDDLDKLRVKFQQDTVFDFMTKMWGISTVPFQGYHYVTYRARARLIRFPEGKIVWQGACDVEDKDLARMPHWTEFVENNGALLKEKLNKLADSCANELVAQFSGKETLQ